jgi:hypothetical protein
MSRPAYDILIRGSVAGTHGLVIVEERAWDAAVRSETQQRVEACLRLLSEDGIPEAKSVKEIMVMYSRRPNRETNAFFDSLRILLSKYGIRFSAQK